MALNIYILILKRRMVTNVVTNLLGSMIFIGKIIADVGILLEKRLIISVSFFEGVFVPFEICLL